MHLKWWELIIGNVGMTGGIKTVMTVKCMKISRLGGGGVCVGAPPYAPVGGGGNIVTDFLVTSCGEKQ